MISETTDLLYRVPPETTETVTLTDYLNKQNQRIRDLELVGRVHQKALDYLLVSLTAKHSRDLKEKIWPGMDAAGMILGDE